MKLQTWQKIITLHILPKEVRKWKQPDNEIWSVKEYFSWGTWGIFFLEKHTKNVVEKLVPDPFIKYQN